MNNIEGNSIKIETARLIIDFFHRTMMHHALWFAEVQHQYGREKAFELMDIAFKQSYDIQMKRLSKILNFEISDGIPMPLLDKSTEDLQTLKEGVAFNWLANDGVWFQTVENTYGMLDAKRCNDSCWAQFSPFEAWSVKKMLQLPDDSGLEGLKKALQYRLYAAVNKQEIVEETENSFVFRMVDCRVQSARKRKGLADYPCKSAGIVEYRTFAETIDKHIKPECIGCPPDEHPEGWFCSWKFKYEV
ncbi:MAG: DUF6125 family protein [Bacteroidota bacterium]